MKILLFVLLALGVVGSCHSQTTSKDNGLKGGNDAFVFGAKTWRIAELRPMAVDTMSILEKILQIQTTSYYLDQDYFSGDSPIVDPLTIHTGNDTIEGPFWTTRKLYKIEVNTDTTGGRLWIGIDTTPQMFKPGSTYLAGQLVQDVYGTVWRVMRRVGIAVSPPSQGIYYSYVRVKEPSMVTANGYNVLDYGISPANSPEVNSLAWESFLTLIPEQAAPSIYFPFGEYRFARALILYKRPVYLHGDNGTIFGNSTKLFFPYNSDGIKIDRGGASIQETIIEKICLIGAGGDGSKGNGIYTNSRIKLRDVTTKSFSQNGVLIYANLEEGGEASGSIIESCHSLENNHDGFFAGKVDGNAILFINCDARDNGRHGFNEDSFLGNTYIACMAHSNKAGDMYVRDKNNARTTIVNFYSEGGNKPSELSRLTTIVGGIWGTGYTQ